MYELNMLSSMMNRLASALDWSSIVYMAFIFIVAIWKPQRIAAPGTFRLSIILFALSIIAPAPTSAGSNLYNMSEPSSAGVPFSSRPSSSGRPVASGSTMFYALQVTHDVSRAMFGVAVLLGVLSLVATDYSARSRHMEDGSPHNLGSAAQGSASPFLASAARASVPPVATSAAPAAVNIGPPRTVAPPAIPPRPPAG